MGRLHERHHKHSELIKKLLSDYEIKSAEDLSNALRDVFSGTIEDMLEAELDGHLGYERNDQGEKATADRRNGKQSKKIISHFGGDEISVPRDRDGSFEPKIVPKGQKDITGIEGKVMSMYGKGLSTRDMQDIIADIYGFEISPETISRIILTPITYRHFMRPLNRKKHLHCLNVWKSTTRRNTGVGLILQKLNCQLYVVNVWEDAELTIYKISIQNCTHGLSIEIKTMWCRLAIFY